MRAFPRHGASEWRILRLRGENLKERVGFRTGCNPVLNHALACIGSREAVEWYAMLEAAQIGVLAIAAAVGSTDWPQFLGPTRDGVYAGGDMADAWPAEGPRVAWKANVGEGFSGPVVVGDRLVVFHRRGDKETVECLEASSGDRRWAFEYPTSYRDSFGADDDGPRATPAVAGGRVFTMGAEGKIHATDLEGGKRLWSLDAQEDLGADLGYFGMASSPLVEGEKVLFNIGGRNGAGIVALEAATGKILWKATDDDASCSSPVAATMGGKRHAFFFTRSGLRDIDPETGAVRFGFPWRARIAASVNAASPLVVGDLVFVSASYQTGAALLRVKDGEPEKVWTSDDALSCHYATSVHRGGFLYGFDGRVEARPSFRCVELATGKVRWSRDRFGAGSVTLAGERLLILKEDGELILTPAAPEELKPLARARILDGTVRAFPALASGRLYARGGGKLVCIDL